MESKSTTKYSEQYMKLCEISPIEDETEMLPIQFLIILWRYTVAVCVYREISLLFSLEYKSRDSYSRLIEFSPKFFYFNLVFE